MQEKHKLKYSPIVIFSYNRKTRLKNLINSLKKNKEFKDTKIFIFQDNYKKKDEKKNIKKVINVINYINKLHYKNIKIIFRKTNYGLARNITSGVTKILNRYEKIIVLEDDLLVSKNFLKFMNEALIFYQNKKKIWHINGWSYDISEIDRLKYDNYFLSFPSSWGWATWKNRWKYFEKNPAKIIKKENMKNIRNFNLKNSYNFYSQIERNFNNKINTWAIFWYYNIFKKNKLCVYPKTNLVINTGFDKHATNTRFINNLFKNKKLDKVNKLNFFFNKLCVENENILKKIKFKMKLNKYELIFKNFF